MDASDSSGLGGDRVILVGGCLSIAMAQDLSEFATQVRR